jgi:hypothetical protein
MGVIPRTRVSSGIPYSKRLMTSQDIVYDFFVAFSLPGNVCDGANRAIRSLWWSVIHWL